MNQGLPQLALERDGANALLRRYTYGLRRLTMVAGSTTSFYHYDGLGSVASITGGAGNTRWTYSYDPFGGLRSEQQGAGTQPANLMRYTGEYNDPTGFYHLRARQYEVSLGRFLQPDPIDSAVGSAYESGYSYAGCRPTVLVDPSGMTPTGAGVLAAELASSARSSRLIPLTLVDKGDALGRGCQLAKPMRIAQEPDFKNFEAIALFIDQNRSLVRVFGTVVLKTTKSSRVEGHRFDVSKTEVDIRGRRWTDLPVEGTRAIRIYHLGRAAEDPARAIEIGDDSYGRARVTARHAFRSGRSDCVYEGKFYAR